jgi:hypothetical protein
MRTIWKAGLALAAAALPSAAFADDSNTIYLNYGEPFQVAQTSSTVQQQRSQPQPAVAPEPQHWAIAIGGLYTTRNVETAGWLPNVEVDYSATDRLQFHAMVPYAYDNFAGTGQHWGIGDVETGVRYRFIDDDPNGATPAVAVYPLIDFPTGDKNENLGTGSTHAFLPLWFSKSLGTWTPYAGGGYWINPGTNNKNWTFFSVGTVKAINASWSLTGEVFYAGASKVGLQSQTGFDVGARYNINDNNHVVLTVGRGIVNAQQTNQFTGYLAYVMTF